MIEPFRDGLLARARMSVGERLPSARSALWIAISVQLFIAAVAILSHDGSSSGPDGPDRWDPRVVELMRFVERERGLTFKHPVHVDFLTSAEYTEQTTSEEDSLEDDRREALDLQAGELRALGMASGEVDLFAAFNAVADGGTLAFYDPLDKRVRVRGTTVTIALRVTLVHELVHALQDQHFDLNRLYVDDLDRGASGSFRALIEGDALRVEDAFVQDELSAAEKAEYAAEYAQLFTRGSESTSDVPSFVTARFNVAYQLGRPFVSLLFNIGKNSVVNDALRRPPTTSEHLFDPASFLLDEGSTTVASSLSEKIKSADRGPFGSADWYLLLAERIDPKIALDAALGWAGDSYVTFKRGGRVCVRATFAGDSKRDDAEMGRALRAWADLLPGDGAKVTNVDGHPGFEACDPGEEVDMELTGRAASALNLPELWSYLIANEAGDLDAKGARCYARGVIDALTYEQIADPSGAIYLSDGFQELQNTVFLSCS